MDVMITDDNLSDEQRECMRAVLYFVDGTKSGILVGGALYRHILRHKSAWTEDIDYDILLDKVDYEELCARFGIDVASDTGSALYSTYYMLDGCYKLNLIQRRSGEFASVADFDINLSMMEYLGDTIFYDGSENCFQYDILRREATLLLSVHKSRTNTQERIDKYTQLATEAGYKLIVVDIPIKTMAVR